MSVKIANNREKQKEKRDEKGGWEFSMSFLTIFLNKDGDFWIDETLQFTPCIYINNWTAVNQAVQFKPLYPVYLKNELSLF
jgi:hypothetical protein